jgi:hypothetical protein
MATARDDVSKLTRVVKLFSFCVHQRPKRPLVGESMKKHCGFWIALGIAVASPNARGSAEQLAGSWQRTSSSLTVRVDSWGDDCGPAPKSYSNKTVTDVEIVAQGRHLVFTKGGLRTDRCSSPNPKLATKSESVSATRWERVCETPPNDSKYERDEYLFEASGEDRIEYSARSSYDWTLNGDHCALSLEEHRVFARVADLKTPESSKEEKGDEASTATPAESVCERQGRVRRLQIVPKDAELGPGARLCFKAFGYDDGGCRFEAEAAWSAEQNGVAVGGLLSQNGCFQAGATAAESEGMYAIVAQFEGKKATSAVTVAFPDYGALGRVRLNPSSETDAGAQGSRSAAPMPSATGPLTTSSTKAPSHLLLAIVVAAVAAALVGALLFVAFRVRRNAAKRRSSSSFYSMSPPAAPPRSSVDSGRSFAEPSEPPGMVCPTCHRAYDADARFCPHDSSRLLPYPEWRAMHRGSK